jgi:N-acetylglucosaminyl-diphospho-decaprenol L-rhamnosyltransferase
MTIGQYPQPPAAVTVAPVRRVDVVTVSYNSAAELRRCVEPLAGLEDVAVFVVDNASSDGSLQTVADLDVVLVPLRENGGFARGCNAGWRRGRSPYVLFVNPDATIGGDSLERLVDVLEREGGVGAVAPLVLDGDGALSFSLRRFPLLRRTFAQALFLHRLFPRAAWTDELIRDERRYERPWSPEWVSGACLLVRRSVLEQLDGWDERFFLYSEDVDLCRRIRASGWDIRFEPAAVCRHVGGASGPKSMTQPLLVQARIRYFEKHHGRVRTVLERCGMALGSLLRLAGGRTAGAPGHAQALLVAASLPRRTWTRG